MYTGEPGVFSTLTAVSGGYQLVRHDQVRYTFDADGRLLSETNRNGDTLAFSRDATDNLTAITDTAGRVMTVGSDGNGHIASLTLSDGRSVQYV